MTHHLTDAEQYRRIQDIKAELRAELSTIPVKGPAIRQPPRKQRGWLPTIADVCDYWIGQYDR